MTEVVLFIKCPLIFQDIFTPVQTPMTIVSSVMELIVCHCQIFKNSKHVIMIIKVRDQKIDRPNRKKITKMDTNEEENGMQTIIKEMECLEHMKTTAAEEGEPEIISLFLQIWRLPMCTHKVTFPKDLIEGADFNKLFNTEQQSKGIKLKKGTQ